ncbi:probable metabolite transport protein CsbC [Manduca sexta]|uniref:probable metabolite transport protein CsbC n=1 Tax=Manduca sexta TaxID=7130 RepID=UPI0018909519|nr:probable metabolite transport protein CsbC [Manduca sexta]
MGLLGRHARSQEHAHVFFIGRRYNQLHRQHLCQLDHADVVTVRGGHFFFGPVLVFMSLASESVPMAKRNLVVLLISSIFLLAQGVMAVLAIPVVPLRFSHHLPALGIYWNSWRTLVIVYSLPSIVSAIWLIFMQESPKFIYTMGDREKALQHLTAIYKVNKMKARAEYPVQSLLLDSTEKNEEKSSAKDQIVPLFKMPLLKYTIIMILLFAFQQIGSFLVWLPTILNQFITNIETGEGTNLTVCGVLRLGIENPIEPDPDAVPCAINETALLMLLAVGVMKSLVNSLLSLIVNKVGRRNLVMMISALCGICGILVNLVPNAYGSIVLFGIFSVGIIVLGFYTAIIVALFPTHLRALAIALPLTCGRLAVFAGIQILNVLLTINCDVGFYVFATIYASSAIVASFLPDDRKLVPTVAPSEDKELTQKEEMPQRSMTEL